MEISRFLAFSLSLAVILFPPTTLAQEPANRAAAKRPAPGVNAMDQMLRAHIRHYFGDQEVPEKSLGIKSVNGVAFNDLKHGMSIGAGGEVEYWNGRPTPIEGSPIEAAFQDDILTVTGIANGRRGFKSISRVKVAPGTKLVLVSGATYEYISEGWRKR